ncbi:hypothetical protein [Nonomuraea sp. NPDC050643]
MSKPTPIEILAQQSDVSLQDQASFLSERDQDLFWRAIREERARQQ